VSEKFPPPVGEGAGKCHGRRCGFDWARLMRRTAGATLGGLGTVAASWMGVRFVHRHPVLGKLRLWRSRGKRWGDRVFIASAAAAESNETENRAMSGRGLIGLRRMILDKNDLGSGER